MPPEGYSIRLGDYEKVFPQEPFAPEIKGGRLLNAAQLRNYLEALELVPGLELQAQAVRTAVSPVDDEIPNAPAFHGAVNTLNLQMLAVRAFHRAISPSETSHTILLRLAGATFEPEDFLAQAELLQDLNRLCLMVVEEPIRITAPEIGSFWIKFVCTGKRCLDFVLKIVHIVCWALSKRRQYLQDVAEARLIGAEAETAEYLMGLQKRLMTAMVERALADMEDPALRNEALPNAERLTEKLVEYHLKGARLVLSHHIEPSKRAPFPMDAGGDSPIHQLPSELLTKALNPGSGEPPIEG